MSFKKIITIFSILIFNYACSEKTIYSGKIINQEKLSSFNYTNKVELIKGLGSPSYFDPIQNTLFYYTEMNKNKNFYNKKTEYSYIFVFRLDSNDQIIKKKVYDLSKIKNNKFVKKETDNNIVERGIIEKIFGGVGQNQLPNSP